MAAYSDLQDSVEYARTLAENKLGPGARVEHRVDGWAAERGGRRIMAESLSVLVWRLGQMPDVGSPS